MVFQQALNFLDGKQRRKFARNTYFERLSQDCIGVLGHQTYIVKIYANQTVELDTGGWNTWFTRNRMNRVLGMLFNGWKPRTFTTKGTMFLTEGRGTRIEYFDNLLLNAAGRCVNYWNRE